MNKQLNYNFKWRKSIYGSVLFVLLLNFSSCVSTKDVTYFQPASKEVDQIVSVVEKEYTPRIKEGDILSIIVSSLNKEANEMFNPIVQTNNVVTQSVGTIAPTPIVGFTVDKLGYISLPLIGEVNVKGLTSLELTTILTEKFQQYLESPTVMVRIANYSIAILGEVARPALYTIANEKITLPQALALAGDIGIYGKKKNVLIIRETAGERAFVRVDMTGRDFFNSPYYYLHSGDIIYVEPMAGKITSSDRLIQLTPIVISSLTLLVLIINTFTK